MTNHEAADHSAFRRGAEAMREMAKQAASRERANATDDTQLATAYRIVTAISALPLPEAPPSRDDATEVSEALRIARVYIERARLNLSFAKQDAVSTAAEAESNRNSAYHDCVKALAALDALAKGGA